MFIAFICVIVLIIIIGLILPAERSVTRQSVLDASPEIVYNIVTDNTEWMYRSDLNELRISDRRGEVEEWEEITKDGAVIRFMTKDKIPYSFYSFEMESNLFTGYWFAEFKETGDNKTLFTATENIRMKNIFLKVFSYIFFDIGKFMETYQNDLKQKLKENNIE